MEVQHKSFKGYSHNSRRLIHWLIADYSNSKTGADVGFNPDEYHMNTAKKELKKEYLKSIGWSKRNIQPFKNFRNILTEKVKDTLKKGVSDNTKSEIILDDVDSLLRSEFQKILLQVDETFSMQMNLFSQENANRFTAWLFDYLQDNDIPLRNEIMELYSKQDNNRYIYSMLRKKKCAICGKQADLHHWDSVASIGGYDKDNGLKTRFMPLCREHHTEFHNIGIKEFQKKYLLTGIYLTKECIPILKKVYPNHFRAFKEEL